MTKNARPQAAYRTKRGMVGLLGVSTVKGLNDFLAGPCFAPFYTEFEDDFLRPNGMSRVNGPQLRQVLRHFEYSERNGKQKFSTRVPYDKRNWDQIDHLALMLFKMEDFNQKNSSDLFFSSSDNQDTIHKKLWYCIKYKRANQAPSRVATQGSSSAQQPPPLLATDEDNEDEEGSSDTDTGAVGATVISIVGGGMMFSLLESLDETDEEYKWLSQISGNFTFHQIIDYVTAEFQLVRHRKRISRLVRGSENEDEITRTNWDEYVQTLLYKVKKLDGVIVELVDALEDDIGLLPAI